MNRFLLGLICVSVFSCTVADDHDDGRVCLDWDSTQVVTKDCTPFYGELICQERIKTRYWCTLYDETFPEPEGKDDDTEE